MKKFKAICDGYILGIGETDADAINNEITETEYAQLRDLMHDCPAAPEGYAYKLTEALVWELREQPVEEETDEPA